MFGLPHAKQVRRDELRSPVSSPRSAPDPELEELLRSRANNDFTFTHTVDYHVEAQDAGKSDEEETELRLFATPSNAAPTTHKIRLLSPGAGNGEPGFIVKKPRSYYFADRPSGDEEAALRAAAIDAKTVIELSRVPWPGCALPWKVRKISASGIKKAVLVGYPPTLVTMEETIPKRRRKGKKTRIAIRKKLQATKDKQEEKVRIAKEREEVEREKRTRRNREKKIKKKAREKAKKTGDADSTHEQPEAGQAEVLQD